MAAACSNKQQPVSHPVSVATDKLLAHWHLYQRILLNNIMLKFMIKIFSYETTDLILILIQHVWVGHELCTYKDEMCIMDMFFFSFKTYIASGIKPWQYVKLECLLRHITLKSKVYTEKNVEWNLLNTVRIDFNTFDVSIWVHTTEC